MQLNQIMLQAERVPQVIATVLFGAVTGLFLDAAAFGNIKIDMNPTLMWAVVALAGFSTLWCLKNTVFPSVIFVANSSGIKIGRGIFINRLRHIPWERLTKIDEGIIKFLEKKARKIDHA